MTPTIAVLVLALAASFQQAPTAGASPTVVFVCEHGAAKSLIATAYFNNGPMQDAIVRHVRALVDTLR